MYNAALKMWIFLIKQDWFETSSIKTDNKKLKLCTVNNMCIWQQCNRLCGLFANSLFHVFFLVFLDKSQNDFWVKHPVDTEKSFVLGWEVLYWVQLSQDNDSYTSAFSILTLYREFGLY